MLNSNNENNEQQELLDKALFSYVGYHHVQNLNRDLDSNIEEVNKINVPETLDKWFYKFDSDINNNKRKNKYRNIFKSTTNKVAIVFIVVAISLVVLTVSVDAFRVRVFNLIIEATDKYLEIKVEEEEPIRGNSHGQTRDYYIPSYIPKGFELEPMENYGDITITTYTNQNHNYIKLNQSPNGGNLQLDSENAIKRDVIINGSEGIALEKEDFTILFWITDEYTFYIIADIDFEEILKAAESLEINK